MKRLISLVLTVVIMITMMVPLVGNAAETEKLSDMSEDECIAFVKSKGVTIPDDYENESEWGPFVKRIIEIVEKNPQQIFAYNYSVTLEFANAIKAVVNEHYGVSTDALARTMFMLV